MGSRGSAAKGGNFDKNKSSGGRGSYSYTSEQSTYGLTSGLGLNGKSRNTVEHFTQTRKGIGDKLTGTDVHRPGRKKGSTKKKTNNATTKRKKKKTK